MISSTWVQQPIWRSLLKQSKSCQHNLSIGDVPNCDDRKSEVRAHEMQLEDLDAKLRQAEERLQRLESKHKRMQSEQILGGRNSHRRTASRGQFQNSDSEERGFSDDQNSPRSNAINRPY